MAAPLTHEDTFKYLLSQQVDRLISLDEEEEPNINGSRWVLKCKETADGKYFYKARLVTRGFKDSKEYNLDETDPSV